MDGPARLLMTHYCAIGNQPRMQAAVSPDGKTLTFNYVDARQPRPPDAGHMQKEMVLTLLDDNHHTESGRSSITAKSTRPDSILAGKI